MEFDCKFCDKSYASLRSLNRHLTEKHNRESNSICYEENVYANKCLEQGCNVSFKLNAELRKHLVVTHSFSMDEEVLKFSNIQEFNSWLEEIRTTLNVDYIQPRGKSVTSDTEIVYYNCNRSGKTRDTSIACKRMKKVQESRKINSACTSQIKVIINKNNILATFYKTHYGHKNDIKHLPLQKCERASIANKLSSGIPISRILNTNRQNFDESHLKRIDLLTRKDIHNIKTEYNIQIQEGVRDSKDAISVDLFVQECQQSEDNPILLYKRQDEEHENHRLQRQDFCIIIMNTSQANMLKRFGTHVVAIDSTHGLNPYNFELTTLVVIDEWGEGFPGACMLTNRKDTVIFEVFFEKIKEKIGPLAPRTFMSDITSVFYNAWLHIMGPVSCQLYCAWHVDRAWQSNLSKVKNADKKKYVYNSLKILQTVTNPEEFHTLLSNVIYQLFEDEETHNFGIYFKNTYGTNYHQWAYCYRINSGINTNMRLESMHKIIKYMYLGAKTIKRLDKGLYALNQYIRDKIVDRLIKNVKGKSTSHNYQINLRHKTAIQGNFTIVANGDDVWTLKEEQKLARSNNSAEYTVSRSRNELSICCWLMCSLCKICIHTYSCTCVDFLIRNTICKHIHSIALMGINQVEVHQDEACTSKTGDQEKEEIKEHLKTLSRDQNNETQKKSTLIKNIIKQANKLEQGVINLDNINVLTHVAKTLKNENYLIESSNKSISNFSGPSVNIKEPSANKKIAKQLNFYSTNKKRKKKINEHLKKPDETEADIIKISLLEKREFISKDPSLDHNYF